ncbi:hypothetical protein DCMF_05435 [Candidatus Formimonas warabiya]|uniref:Uncharacterized protein n=2 Tax=Formimonas warabiya TaxID=1761012 RepID=A0A3G1KQ94_FORW1|nr:hypothetical protein DCMF_05435 [Candidatus Formimonas warabiya]
MNDLTPLEANLSEKRISPKNHLIVKSYFESTEFKNHKETYQEIVKNVILDFFMTLSKDLDMITSSDIFHWLSHFYEENSYQGVDGRFLIIMDLFDFCVERNYIKASPLANIITIGLAKGYPFFKPIRGLK